MSSTQASEATEALFSSLIRSGQLSADAFARARRLAAEAGEPVPATLTRLGFVSEQDMAQAFVTALGLTLADAAAMPRDTLPIPELSPAFLRQMRVLPLAMPSGSPEVGLPLAMADPTDDYAADAVSLFTGHPVRRLVALPTDLDAALDRLLPHSDSGEGNQSVEELDGFSIGGIGSSELDRLREAASDAPVIRLVNSLLGRAVDDRASDLHMEPTADGLTVRLNC
jgi:general secretion pathway protein E